MAEAYPEPTEPDAELIDYTLINARNPDLYAELPTLEELAAIKPGSFVKVGLDPLGANPEHFWVEVVDQRGPHGLIGLVRNDLQPQCGIAHGQALVFCRHHVRTVRN